VTKFTLEGQVHPKGKNMYTPGGQQMLLKLASDTWRDSNPGWQVKYYDVITYDGSLTYINSIDCILYMPHFANRLEGTFSDQITLSPLSLLTYRTQFRNVSKKTLTTKTYIHSVSLVCIYFENEQSVCNIRQSFN
jgi:hypothetical protein